MRKAPASPLKSAPPLGPPSGSVGTRPFTRRGIRGVELFKTKHGRLGGRPVLRSIGRSIERRRGMASDGRRNESRSLRRSGVLEQSIIACSSANRWADVPGKSFVSTSTRTPPTSSTHMCQRWPGPSMVRREGLVVGACARSSGSLVHGRYPASVTSTGEVTSRAGGRRGRPRGRRPSGATAMSGSASASSSVAGYRRGRRTVPGPDGTYTRRRRPHRAAPYAIDRGKRPDGIRHGLP